MTPSASATARTPIRIGLIGGGTVGGGVYELIMGRLRQTQTGTQTNTNTETSSTSTAAPTSSTTTTTTTATLTTSNTTTIVNHSLQQRPCVITKVCVRDMDKPRSFHLDTAHTTLVTDVNDVIHDHTIDIVVEVMGGTTIAKTVVETCLANNKHVVTANKALVAEYLDHLHALSLTHHTTLAYEAAVCGGIPIIQMLHTGFAGDVIQQVMGICNGTTNYMLGKMELGYDYAEVLKEAQDLGYAEADPTADVEGHDVRAKISILAKLAFGTTVPVESIPCKGISQITSVDFEYAKSLDCTIKLVGTAARMSQYGEHDGALSVYVAPYVVHNTHLLASARGSGNAVAVQSANMGISSYTGPGAGRYPTANSVVADVMRIATNTATTNPFPLQSALELDHNYTSSFYIRIPFRDSLGIIRRVGELAENQGVSIHSILQNPIKDRAEADFCITTEECKLSQVQALCDDVDNEDFARSHPLWMPLLMELN